jgi:hypothetical protein
VNEETIELSGIELTVFFEVLPSVGINILFIFYENREVSHLLNHVAIREIKDLIWQKIK